MNREIDTVLFDLDGTIVDTNELIIQSFLHALEGRTPDPITREFLSVNMGRPLIDQMKRFTGKEEVDDVIQIYREFHVRRHDELVTEFPNVSEVLAKLYDSGVTMGVVTSKIRHTTEMSLELYGLDKYMSAIVTIEDVKHPKPHAEPVQQAIELLKADPARTLMVGDSHYDIVSGQGAGLRTAGVAWSLKDEEFLRSYKPDFMLQDMRELLDIVGVEKVKR
jgi:pyrophosphatase PpaX